MVNLYLDVHMKKYEKVTHAFAKFFNEYELDKIIEEKVDNRTMLRIAQTKASRTELDNTIQIIESMYARLRSLSILTVEMARSLVPVVGNGAITGDKQELLNAKAHKR